MIVKAPNKYKKDSKLAIFLAGSIDEGKAVNWQEKIAKHFDGNDNILLLNPRRDDWDSSWKQEMGDKQFTEQVNWELDGMETADLIALVLTKDSKAPISLLELGIHVDSKKLIVFCEEGFYRKGNVDIVCDRHKVDQVESIDDILDILDIKLKGRNEINENLNRFA